MGDENKTLTFFGPYSWHGKNGTEDLHTCEMGKKSGVYLWTIKQNNGELIYYIGETSRSFSVRMTEHFREHCSGGYHFYAPAKFGQGIKEQLWPGRFVASQRTSIAEFLDKYDSFQNAIKELAFMYRFYVAPFEGERRIRERIESGLAYYLYKQEGLIGNFQDKGVHYRRRWESEMPEWVCFESESILLGLPDKLEI